MAIVTSGSMETALEPPEPQLEGQPSAEDTARSAQNIALWKSYLPDDCVETMISMGWDRSV